jgi:hypothetical protein
VHAQKLCCAEEYWRAGECTKIWCHAEFFLRAGTHAKIWRHAKTYLCVGACAKIWRCAEKYRCAGAHAKIWCCVEKYWCAGARTKFSIAQYILSNTCVIMAHSVHTHNNGERGVCSIRRAQRNFVGARAMWVYVVVQ